MNLGRRFLALPILLALASSSSCPAPVGANQRHGTRVTDYAEGHPLCPVRRLIIGDVTVRGGHCYVVVVVRDGETPFVAFADPPLRIPQGQVARLDTPEGMGLRARILYRVPMPAQVSAQMLGIPPNTMQLVRLHEEDEIEETGTPQQGLEITRVVQARLTVILTGAPQPAMSVTFAVRF